MARIIPQQAQSDTANTGPSNTANTGQPYKGLLNPAINPEAINPGHPYHSRAPRPLFKQGHPQHHCAPEQQTGVTMLELAVVLTVLAILLTLAVPSFNELIQSNRLSADASNVLSQLAYARSEATKRRAHIVICGSRDQSHCDPSTGADWSTGWIIFADANGDGLLAGGADACPTDTPTTTSDCVLRVQGVLSANNLLSNAAKLASIVMRADGSLANTTEPVQFTLCTDKSLARDKEHEIILGVAGHVSHNPFTCTTGQRH